MRAVVYDRYGGPEVLHLEDVPRPEPGPGEIRIRVCAAEVTKADTELRSFHFPVQWFAVPLRVALGIRRPRRRVLGGYLAGVVDALGPGVSRFSEGDAIYGSAALRMGGHGEYTVLPEGYTLAPMPKNLTFEEAAAVPLGGLNALHFLRLAAVQQGERVLVNGAGGSIGTFGVQIARALGARVTAVDAAHKEAMLQSLGVERFVDYAREDFTAEGPVYDVVFDMVASSSYTRCMAALRPDGRYVTGNPTVEKMARSILTSALSKKRAGFAFAGETLAELEELTRLIEADEIRPVVDRVFPLEEAALAHDRVATEQRLGVVVLAVASSRSRS